MRKALLQARAAIITSEDRLGPQTKAMTNDPRAKIWPIKGILYLHSETS